MKLTTDHILLVCTPTLFKALCDVEGIVPATCILDESFDPMQFNSFPLGTDQKLRQDGFALFEKFFSISDNGGPLMVEFGQEDIVKALARDDHDRTGDAFAPFSKIAAMVNDPSQHAEITADVSKLRAGESGRIQVASTISPEVFRPVSKVLIMSALFEQSTLYMVWKNTYNVDFQWNAPVLWPLGLLGFPHCC
jgi:hypothetical protein